MGKGRFGVALGPDANAGPGLLAFPRTDSNALLVSGAHTVSGRPIAVMGPQVSYFSPEILMEEDIHGPGIDANGAAFPGVNLYVELGHGPDYAWSATSSGQNITDTFAAPLCNPSGGTPTIDSNYYVLASQCVPMQTLTRTESWTPSLADMTPPGAGSLARCRAALESSLLQAIGESPQRVYPSDGVCQAGDQMCSDSIQFRAIGAITQPLIEWINRPTFQQAVEIQGHAS